MVKMETNKYVLYEYILLTAQEQEKLMMHLY